jgi:hypothetical protein
MLIARDLRDLEGALKQAKVDADSIELTSKTGIMAAEIQLKILNTLVAESAPRLSVESPLRLSRNADATEGLMACRMSLAFRQAVMAGVMSELEGLGELPGDTAAALCRRLLRLREESRLGLLGIVTTARQAVEEVEASLCSWES